MFPPSPSAPPPFPFPLFPKKRAFDHPGAIHPSQRAQVTCTARLEALRSCEGMDPERLLAEPVKEDRPFLSTWRDRCSLPALAPGSPVPAPRKGLPFGSRSLVRHNHGTDLPGALWVRRSGGGIGLPNQGLPHSSLGYRPPASEAIRPDPAFLNLSAQRGPHPTSQGGLN